MPSTRPAISVKITSHSEPGCTSRARVRSTCTRVGHSVVSGLSFCVRTQMIRLSNDQVQQTDSCAASAFLSGENARSAWAVAPDAASCGGVTKSGMRLLCAGQPRRWCKRCAERTSKSRAVNLAL
jgi:hypothetical protein